MSLIRFKLPTKFIKSLQEVSKHNGGVVIFLTVGAVCVDADVGNVRILFDYQDGIVRDWQGLGFGIDKLNDVRLPSSDLVEFVFDPSTRFIFINGHNLGRTYDNPCMCAFDEDRNGQSVRGSRTISYEIVGKILGEFGVDTFSIDSYSNHYSYVNHELDKKLRMYVYNV